MKRTNIGGQAVIEGVMMMGKEMYAMAVRVPEGNITVEKNPKQKILSKYGLFKLPIFRGIAAFFESLVTGMKIIMRSAQLAGLEDGTEEPSKFEKYLSDKFGDKLSDILIYVSVFFSILFSIGLFFLLPVFIGSFFKPILPGTWALGIVEGIVRIAIFLGYIWLIARMDEIKRVYQYHGAEHKTINCFESGAELTVENVKKHTRLHKRCGTSFLLIVMFIAIIVFSTIDFIFPTPTTLVGKIGMKVSLRVLLMPLIAGISYEIQRYTSKHLDNSFIKLIAFPGLSLQKITTKEPDLKQLEVAIVAIKAALDQPINNAREIKR